MLKIIAEIEDRVAVLAADVDGKARADLRAALDALRADTGRVKLLLADARHDIEQVIAQDAAAVLPAVETRFTQLAADLGVLLAGGT